MYSLFPLHQIICLHLPQLLIIPYSPGDGATGDAGVSGGVDINGRVTDEDGPVCRASGFFHDERDSRGIGFERSGGFGTVDAGEKTVGIKCLQDADREVFGFVGEDGKALSLLFQGFKPFPHSRIQVGFFGAVFGVFRAVFGERPFHQGDEFCFAQVLGSGEGAGNKGARAVTNPAAYGFAVNRREAVADEGGVHCRGQVVKGIDECSVKIEYVQVKLVGDLRDVIHGYHCTGLYPARRGDLLLATTTRVMLHHYMVSKVK